MPLSYIRANYDIVIASLIEELLAMKSAQKQEKYQRAIEQGHFDLVGIKLVERCYDLEHADGYQDQQYIRTLAQETLDIDVPVAKQFFADTLAQQLESVTSQVLKRKAN